ncbi:MAG TPA: Mut7-C RNAse domain-containing protein [Nitrosarchaeum sp.]|nr:Mut7-C RNAse domain-containing protein [Nitrosarchaeum sp.]
MPLKTSDEPKFFVDAMLGNIAKKLRLLGYDSQYFSDIDDEKLIHIARKEKRIIISKDEELIKRTQKLGIKSIYITEKEEIEQFLEIITSVNLKKIQINGNTARCPKCNSITESIDKNDIKGESPVAVFNLNDIFWKCKCCNQLYWEGTHIKNLQTFVGKVNERL